MSAPAREVVTEREVREELARLDAYRSQLSSLLQQHQLLGSSRADHERARATLETLDGLERGREIVIPLGAEAYVRGTASAESRVLFGLGSGVVVEMDRAKVVELLAQRTARLDRASEELDGQVRSVEERIERISERLESLAPEGASEPSSDVGRT